MNTGKKGKTRTPAQSLSRLRSVQRRFEQWRRERKGRAKIPESLWRAAVKMAETYGVNRAATALRLDYYTLKNRVKAKAADDASRVGTASPFLEVSPFGPIGTGECTVELEDFKGAAMRIQLRGYAAPDLAALTRSFWSSDS